MCGECVNVLPVVEDFQLLLLVSDRTALLLNEAAHRNFPAAAMLNTAVALVSV